MSSTTSIPESGSGLPEGSKHPLNLSATVPLLNGKMTLEEALDDEDNVLSPLAYSSQLEDFLFWVYEHRDDFNAIVSLHLGLQIAKHADLENSAMEAWKL